MSEDIDSKTDDQGWASMFKAAVGSGLGVLIENEREQPTNSSGASASPGTYAQGPANVHQTSQATQAAGTLSAGAWLQQNKVLVGVLALAVLVLLVMLFKVVL